MTEQEKFFKVLRDVLNQRAQKKEEEEDPELAWNKWFWVYPIENPHTGYGGMGDIYMNI